MRAPGGKNVTCLTKETYEAGSTNMSNNSGTINLNIGEVRVVIVVIISN